MSSQILTTIFYHSEYIYDKILTSIMTCWVLLPHNTTHYCSYHDLLRYLYFDTCRSIIVTSIRCKNFRKWVPEYHCHVKYMLEASIFKSDKEADLTYCPVYEKCMFHH